MAGELVARGAVVVLCDVDGDGVRAAAAEIGGEALTLDVSDAQAVARAVDGVVARQGRIDLIINNAGYAISGEVRHLSADQFRRITEVNYLGVVYGAHAAYRHMLAQGHGQIVNVASLFGLVPAPMSAAYSATKHAVVGFSRSLRLEAQSLGVRVNTVCPGFIRTGLFDNAEYRGATREAMLKQVDVPMIDAGAAAAKILDGAQRDVPMITFPRYVGAMRWMDRHAPFLLRRFYARALRDHRALPPPNDHVDP